MLNYKDGIYHHVSSSDDVSVNPWEETNHAVVVVGWGVDSASQENYWIVKNSWGRHFGLTGYFYVRRSTDEIAIESMALSAGRQRALRGDMRRSFLHHSGLFLSIKLTPPRQSPSFNTWSTLVPTPAAPEIAHCLFALFYYSNRSKHFNS